MSKLTFKRLALAVVVTLGFGVLSSGPSLGAFTPSSDTLSLSATSSTIAAGETASVTVSVSAVANATGDSLVVTVTNQSAPASGNGTLGFYITDSSNAAIRTSAQTANLTAGTATDPQADYFGSAGTDLGTNITMGVGLTTASAVTAFSASARLSFMAPTVAGTYTFRIINSHAAGAIAVAAIPLTWTVTVTANTSDTGTTASKFWLNGLDEYTATSRGATVTSNTYKGLEVDSSLVVSAGVARAASAYTAVGVIHPVVMNSSDTKISTRTGGRVLESMTVLISGAGQLSVHSRYTGLATAATRTYSKQVLLAYDETAVVYSDGTVGAGTLTAYIGGSSTSVNALTQGSKTVTFTGRATTFTVSGYSAAIRAGSSVAYTGAGDSATAAAQAIRFIAKDAAGNAVTAATLNTDKGDAENGFYAISSDTSVLAKGEAGATFATSADRRSPALSCTYDSTSSIKGYWYCSGRVFDSGTVTITIVDSRTLSGSSVLTTTTDAVAKSDPFSITFAGNGYTGTIALDKSEYTINSAATLTLTCKDSAGRNVADGNNTGCFSNLKWSGTAPAFSADSSVNAAGGTFTNLQTYLDGSGTVALNETSFVLGTDTALVFMPATAGTYTLMGRTSNQTTDSTLLTFKVTDPVQDAQSAAIAAAEAATVAAAKAAQDAAVAAAKAAQDAAVAAAKAAQDAAVAAAEKASKEAVDAANAATAAANAATAAAKAAQDAAVAEAQAATDAAAEAIDAANAATDAGNLAAEAADAATVAAEEARDAADAATAAVEELATQVATLMAALQAQIKTLANTVAKIAKKVKA